MNEKPRTVLVLIIAVLAAAWATPLIRLSTAPANSIAAWRAVIASLLLVPVFLGTPAHVEWKSMSRRDLWIATLAGTALAAHFASWIASVHLTSVAASVVLVSMSPIFSGLLSWRFIGERPTARQSAGILLAVGGAAIIAVGDARGGAPNALLGDGLAIVGAMCGAVYFVIGRHLRARLGLVAYVTPVYSVAAIVLLAWATIHGQAGGPFAPREWLIFAALAAGPTLIGHSGLNYALRHLPAYTVGAASLGEPIGATLIAWLLPSIAEPPGPFAIAGGACCLLGIALALTGAPRGPAR